MLSVNLFIGLPFSGEERVPSRNNFTVKECGQRGMIVRESCDLKVATQIRVLYVYVLQIDGEEEGDSHKITEIRWVTKSDATNDKSDTAATSKNVLEDFSRGDK